MPLAPHQGWRSTRNTPAAIAGSDSSRRELFHAAGSKIEDQKHYDRDTDKGAGIMTEECVAEIADQIQPERSRREVSPLAPSGPEPHGGRSTDEGHGNQQEHSPDTQLQQGPMALGVHDPHGVEWSLREMRRSRRGQADQ
jgi:hypothetical protein